MNWQSASTDPRAGCSVRSVFLRFLDRTSPVSSEDDAFSHDQGSRICWRTILSLLSLLFLVMFTFVGIEAQTLAPGWYQQTPATSPSKRYIDAMAYDQAHGQVVLFGGYGNGYMKDTWLWNGTTWSQANPATVPSPRAAEAMAYDATHGQVVMFGGLASVSSRLGDTWIWDGTTWTQASPANSPPARASAVLAYYPGGLLLFGGVSNSGVEINDTWLWNGSNWIQQFPANSPSVRADYSMVYDPALGEVVFFGGDSNLVYQNDTWVWNGQNWIQLSTASNPPARNTQGMVYDQSLGEVVMFGGYNGTFLNDTWVFGSAAGGTSWTQVMTASSPSGRYEPNGVVYDAARSQTVLFGGYNTTQLNDTWEYGLPGNFGSVDVCSAGNQSPAPCSSTLSFTYNVSGTSAFGTPQVVTQGTPQLDFKLASGSTCVGMVAVGTCTVNVTFTPSAPGLRAGAIELEDSSGNILETSPIYGTGQGPAVAISPATQTVVSTTSNFPLNQPKGTTLDAAGNVYIADTGNSRVLKLSPTGAVTTVGVGLNYPQGIAVDGAGDLFIADNNLNEVVEVPAGCTSSSCQQVLGANLRSQLGVAVDGAGNLFIGDFLDGEVFESPAGCTSAACQSVIYNPAGANPVGMTVDASGDLFIADFGLHQVAEVPAGCTSSTCQTTVGQGWVQPEAVAVDAAGDVFVADESLQQVVEVPAGCATISCQVVLLSGIDPIGVAVDQQGNVFSPDVFTNLVKEVVRSQPSLLTFANTYVGNTSSDSPKSVTLQNIGNQMLSASNPGLTIAGSSFVQVPGAGTPADCSASFALMPGAACSLSVSFTPTIAGSPVTSTAAFTDNALNASAATQSVSLSGVALAAQYSVSGAVTGLSGTGLVLQNNLGSTVAVSGNNPFTFTTSYFTGDPYAVTVLSQPSGQSCTITDGSGTITNASVTNVLVTCTNLVNYPLIVTEAGTGTGTTADNLRQISCLETVGGATTTCSGSYASGTSVTLTASASGSSVFVGWGGACSSFGVNASCTVLVTSALSVSASFVAPETNPSGTLRPITAGIVYGQGGAFSSNSVNNSGLSPSTLNNPQGVVVDGSGNLYVSDGANNRVLFYPAGSTTASRAYGQNGSFTSNFSGASATSLNNPQGLALDSSGGLYVADEDNSRVLFYPAGSTTATRVYGQPDFTSGSRNNGGISATSLFQPTGIALDGSGNLYVADYGNSRVLFYSSGSTTATRVYGQPGFSTNYANNGSISVTSLNQPQAVAVDTSGDLYIADTSNNRVLFYPANSTTATQVYGQGGSFTSGSVNNGGVSASSLNSPVALDADGSGGIYVVDRSNNRVLYYSFGSTTANRVYGQGGSFTSNAQNDGGISGDSLSQPWGVALDKGGNVYIADYGNNRVLDYGSFGNVNACKSTPAPCSRTFAMSYAPATTTTLGAVNVVSQGLTGFDFSLSNLNNCTGTIAAGTSCTIQVTFAPLIAGLRQGATEIFDSHGTLSVIAPIYGTGQEPELAFGPGTQTTVNTGTYTVSAPKGVITDGVGNLFISDQGQARVLKLAPSGAVTTVGFNLRNPSGMAEDGAGNFYIADNTLNQVLEVPAGCTTSSCQQVLLQITSPQGIAVDGSGDVFVSDSIDGKVLEIPAGCTSSACQAVVYNQGAGSQPFGIAIDSAGNLFVAATGLQTVVEVPVGCTTAACQVSVGAGWSAPAGVAVDAAGDVYVADSGLGEIVQVPPGCQSAGCQVILAVKTNAQALSVNFAGDIFAGDLANQRVVRFTRSQTPSLSFAQTNVGSSSVDSPQIVLLQNIGNQPLSGTTAVSLGTSFTQTLAANCSSAFTLAPGATCGESLSFTPQGAAFWEGNAVYTDNSQNLSPASQMLSLGGTGAVNGVAGTVAVPNLVGQPDNAVQPPLAAVGLVAGSVTTASSSTVSSGDVISQNPVAGTQVNVGSAVNLLISSGQAQPVSPNPLSLYNNYFLTGDYVSAGVSLRGTGVAGSATGTITIPAYSQSPTQGVPSGADIVDAFLYWETLESTPNASSTNGTFNGYPIVGQQIGNDLLNYTDGQFTGTIRAYRANVNVYLPDGANGIRFAAGNYTVSLPDSGGSALPLTEGASLVLIYRVLSPNFPLKSVVVYDGAALPRNPGAQVVQGFYDAVGGPSGTGKNTNLFASGGTWNNSMNSVALGQSSQYSAPLSANNAYAAVIVSTPVNNSDNDGILDAWKTGPASPDFHAGQPGYYDAKTNTWVGLPGAKHGEKDLFVQMDYMCGAVLASGSCDPNQENLFPSPDANGNDPLAMVQQAFAASGIQLHLTIGNAVPESTCVDNYTVSPAQLCQFPNQPGVVGWKNSLEFSKLYPRNLAACLSGGDCTTRFPYGQKDSYHYVLMGHSLAIPAWNSRYATLTSITVLNGITTIGTVDRGTGINACPSRVTLSGVLGNPSLNGVYNTTTCADSTHITLATPGVPNWAYPNATLPEPVIGLTSGTISSISGYSDLGGADSAVTLGLWLTAPKQDMSKRANVLAGTIFHEIGHTLGLSHGGLYYDTPGSYVPTFDANCKPNYQSVMNYLFQLDLLGTNQVLAYSNQVLSPINENSAGSITSLTDASGNAAIIPSSAWYVPYTSGSPVSPATLHCDGTPLAGEQGYRVDSSIAPISPVWSNGQDLSFIGALQPNERGFNDLTNLDLRQVGATGGEFASLATLLSFGSSVAPLNISAGGSVALGSGGTVALGSGGSVTLGSGGNVTLGSGGTIALGSGGSVTLGSGGNVTLGSGGTIALGSGGNVTLGSGGNVTLGSGGTITLGSGGNVTLGSGGNVTLGSGGTIALGGGGSVTIPSTGGSYTIGSSGGTITLGSGGNITLGSGGNVTLGSGGTVTLGSGGNVALGSGGNVTLGSGGEATLGAGGTITLGSGGNVTLGSGGTIAFGSGGNVTLGSGGNVTLGSGGTITLGSGGTITLGSGGNVTLGSGGVVTLGNGGIVTLGSGTDVSLGSVNNTTAGSGGPSSNEMTYETANSVVRPPSSPSETATPAGVLVTWHAPAFGVVQTYSVFRSSNGAPPVVIGSVSGVGGNAPATQFLDTNPDLTSKTVVYTVTTTLVPGSTGPSRQSAYSTPAVLKNNQTISLGPLPSSVIITNPPTITATAMSSGVPNGLQVAFTAAGTCSIASQSISNNVSSAALVLSATGSCTISASQIGSSSFSAANSVSGTFMVLPQGSAIKPQTINFGSLPNVQYGNTFALAAISSAGLPISFTASGPCTTGGTVSGVGVCKITASAPASSTYSAASVTQAFNILPAVLKVIAANLPSTYGQPLPALTYTLTGFVSGDAAAVVNGVPSLSTTATSASNVGSYSITVSTGTLAAANYSFLYVNGTLTIQPANQLPLILKSSSPLTFGQTETLGVSGGSTGGAVTYNLIAGSSCTLSGASLKATSGTGTCQVSATMASDSNYNAVTSSPANSVSLATAGQTIRFTTSAPASASYRSSFTVAATTQIEGAVVFTSAGACTHSGATYTMTSGTGSCSVIANQPGNANYSAATQVTESVSATLASPTVTFTGAPATAAYHSVFTVAATSDASTTAVITSGGACSNVSTLATMISGTGTCSLTASWPADNNYSAKTTSQTTTATLAGQAITFVINPPATAAYGSVFTVAATGGGSGNPVTFTSAGSCSNSGAIYTLTNSTGTCSVIVNQAGNMNYAAASPVTKLVTANGPLLTVSTASINFGTVYLGSITTKTITLTNNGTAPVIISDPLLSIVKGGTSNEYIALSLCPKPLAVGKSCAVTIAFVAGPFYTLQTADLKIMSNAPGSPQQIALSAIVINPQASFSSTTLQFGTIKHATSSTMSLTLTNTGSTPLLLSSISLTGTNTADFFESNNCGTNLAVGAKCTLLVKFTPAAAGTFTANLMIADNAVRSGNGTQIITLSGKGS